MKEFLFSNTLSTTTSAANVKALVDSFFEVNKLSWQNFKHICTDGCPSNDWRLIRVCRTGEERLAWCDVLSLFTTPIHSTFKDSTFDGSYGRCSQSNHLHSYEGKKSPALPTFGQRNESATCGTFVVYQSLLAVERQMPLLVV